MCGLRTRPRRDVDPPRFLPPSNCHRRRGHVVSPPPGRYLVYFALFLFLPVILTDITLAAAGGGAGGGGRDNNDGETEAGVPDPAAEPRATARREAAGRRRGRATASDGNEPVHRPTARKPRPRARSRDS